MRIGVCDLSLFYVLVATRNIRPTSHVFPKPLALSEDPNLSRRSSARNPLLCLRRQRLDDPWQREFDTDIFVPVYTVDRIRIRRGISRRGIRRILRRAPKPTQRPRRIF